MILMTNGKKKKFVADALVSTYEKKGFIAVAKPAPVETSEEVPEETTEDVTEEVPEETATEKKTKTRKKAAE